MTCLEVQELLSAFVDNELDEDNMNKIHEHMEKCSNCKKAAEELKSVILELSSLEDVPVPEAFNEKLHEALVVEGENIRNSKVITMNTKKRLNWRRISSLAAVFLVGLFSIILYNDNLDDFNEQDLNTKSCVNENTVEEIKDADVSDIKLEKDTEVENVQNPDAELRSVPNQAIAPYSQPSIMLDSVEEYQTPQSINIQDSNAEINNYLEELDKILIESDYKVNSYTQSDEENMWIIDITIISTTSEGKEIKEDAVYYGQDGKLWKKEL